MRKEIEIGFWAKWIPGAVRSYRQAKYARCAGTRIEGGYEYSDLSRPIYDHLKKLLPKSSGIDMGRGFIQYDSELKKLVSWAENWKPSKTFGGIKTLAAPTAR